jgi:ribosomal protein S18 acetylase RimI-like enzyme
MTRKVQILDGKNYISEIKELILEYTNSLGRDLSFQCLDEELSNPAMKYTTPQGEILVAIDEGLVVGMVAYHRHSDTRCEMKRLYVKPETRKQHIGETLVREILIHAISAGYTEMVLDTIKPLTAAINLYQKFGFKECNAYYNNPMEDVIYMKREL